MSAWLVVLLAAPLASFGEEPGNARRGSADRPTRSALIGLAGAALGIARDETERQTALASAFLTATRTLASGTPLTDFHTYQSLPASVKGIATRAEALARRADLETSITRRDYRSDGRWQVAFRQRADAAFTLADLEAAFLRPRFVLYAGRKSCALAFPLVPTIVETDSVEAAFLAHARRLAPLRPEWFDKAENVIAVDERIAPSGANRHRLHRRNDDPGDRVRWQFSRRAERVYRMPNGGASKILEGA